MLRMQENLEKEKQERFEANRIEKLRPLSLEDRLKYYTEERLRRNNASVAYEKHHEGNNLINMRFEEKIEYIKNKQKKWKEELDKNEKNYKKTMKNLEKKESERKGGGLNFNILSSKPKLIRYQNEELEDAKNAYKENKEFIETQIDKYKTLLKDTGKEHQEEVHKNKGFLGRTKDNLRKWNEERMQKSKANTLAFGANMALRTGNPGAAIVMAAAANPLAAYRLHQDYEKLEKFGKKAIDRVNEEVESIRNIQRGKRNNMIRRENGRLVVNSPTGSTGILPQARHRVNARRLANANQLANKIPDDGTPVCAPDECDSSNELSSGSNRTRVNDENWFNLHETELDSIGTVIATYTYPYFNAAVQTVSVMIENIMKTVFVKILYCKVPNDKQLDCANNTFKGEDVEISLPCKVQCAIENAFIYCVNNALKSIDWDKSPIFYSNAQKCRNVPINQNVMSNNGDQEDEEYDPEAELEWNVLKIFQRELEGGDGLNEMIYKYVSPDYVEEIIGICFVDTDGRNILDMKISEAMIGENGENRKVIQDGILDSIREYIRNIDEEAYANQIVKTKFEKTKE